MILRCKVEMECEGMSLDAALAEVERQLKHLAEQACYFTEDDFTPGCGYGDEAELTGTYGNKVGDIEIVEDDDEDTEGEEVTPVEIEK